MRADTHARGRAQPRNAHRAEAGGLTWPQTEVGGASSAAACWGDISHFPPGAAQWPGSWNPPREGPPCAHPVVRRRSHHEPLGVGRPAPPGRLGGVRRHPTSHQRNNHTSTASAGRRAGASRSAGRNSSSHPVERPSSAPPGFLQRLPRGQEIAVAPRAQRKQVGGGPWPSRLRPPNMVTGPGRSRLREAIAPRSSGGPGGAS